MTYKNILITGGAGFIGSNLCLALLSHGCAITVIDNLSPQIHGENPFLSPLFLAIKEKVRFIHGDVCDKEVWRGALTDIDAVVHLAAETGTGQSMYQIQHYNDVNCGGTAIMLDLLANTSHGVKKVVVASSRAIYGEGKYYSEALQRHVYPSARKEEDMAAGDFAVKCPYTNTDATLCATDEESMVLPASIYGLTKYYQERAILIACHAMGIGACALRYQNVYGPGQSLSNPYTGILSIFSTRMLEHKPINIFEDGKESRDFVYIDDVVSATIAAIFSETAVGAYNVGTGIATDVLTVAQSLQKQYNSLSEISISGQYRIGDIRHCYADMTKSQSALGFSPKVSFQEGIAKFAQWVLTQERQVDRYEQSLLELKEKGLMK